VVAVSFPGRSLLPGEIGAHNGQRSNGFSFDQEKLAWFRFGVHRRSHTSLGLSGLPESQRSPP